MLVITDHQLTLHSINHDPGEIFEEPDEAVAAELIQRGVVRKAMPPEILYETKPKTYETKVPVFETPTVSARPPFRDGVVSHEEQAPVAAESDQGLPAADVPAQGAADRVRRRGRPRAR